MKFCVHCEGQNRDQARFCGHCGRPFSGLPPPESTSQPSPEIRKPLFGAKIYAVLATLGWLTLFMPFVTLRACSVQQTYWGIDWIALQYGEESEQVSHEETLKQERVSPSASLEAALEKLQAEQEKKSKEGVEELLKELYQEAPFYLRLFLYVDPVPEASHILLGLIVGLAWLQWYRLVGWLCVAGLLLCLHAILNIYGHHHLFAHQAFPFGTVEIEPGWGLFVLAGLWGVFYVLNLLQPDQLRWPEKWAQKRLGSALPLVLVGLILFGRSTLLASKKLFQASSGNTEKSAAASSPELLADLRHAKTMSPADVQTAHYDLHIEVLDANEVGRMLEQAYDELQRFFGKAPNGRLRLELYEKQDPLLEILKSEGVSPTNVGGYYSPRHKKVILTVQPSDYYTRHLLLHEVTHQFHHLAATGNQPPSGFWYVEGLAEYFAMHNWDGKTLQVGVIPAITLEDYPEQALQQVTKNKGNLWGLIQGRWGDRSAGWSLIHYLVNNEPKRFRQLAQLLDRQVEPAEAWLQVFGEVAVEQADAWRGWLEQHQQPWRIVWTSLQQVGDALEGKAEANGLALLKENPPHLDVELELVSGQLRAGLVFGYQSPDQFSLWQVQANNMVRLVECKAGKWIVGPSYPLSRDKKRLRLALVQSEKTITLYANEVKLTAVTASGQVGLNVEGCQVHFRVKTGRKEIPLYSAVHNDYASKRKNEVGNRRREGTKRGNGAWEKSMRNSSCRGKQCSTSTTGPMILRSRKPVAMKGRASSLAMFLCRCQRSPVVPGDRSIIMNARGLV